MNAQPSSKAASRNAAERPIRVLHIRDSPWVDGPGRTILETASHIDPSRVDYHIGALVPPGDGAHPMVEQARRRRVNVHSILDTTRSGKNALRQIGELIERLQIDILHTSEFRSNLLSRVLKTSRPILRVTTVHGWIANTLQGRISRALDKVLLRGFDAAIMVSQATRDLVPRWWLPESRVRVLYNALVLETYGGEHATIRRRKTDPRREIRLLNVGRLSPEKGQDLLLTAVAELLPRYPTLRLTFAGTGPLETPLREQAKALGLQAKVEFVGFVSEMPPLYAQCDLVVQSSLTEGMPNVVLEAGYLRVPLLATDVGGTREIVEHGRSGMLIPAGSVAPLREGIAAFIEDPASFIARAEAAHERIRSQFSFAARTEKLMGIYEGLLARARP